MAQFAVTSADITHIVDNFDSQGPTVKRLPKIDLLYRTGYGLIARKERIFKQLQHYIKVHP